MKSIINQIIELFFISVLSLGFVACNDDDDSTAKPVITHTEVGHENNKTATAGDDMHLEADIVAEGLIARIDIEIHLEEGGDYEIELSYTDGKYIGVRNTEFHEHIDIPADAPTGEYHLHFTVTDKAGQQTTVESDVNIVASEE